MARWEPDARGRLEKAALDVFRERGYAHTTVGDIAERAGLTERTFFRYFTDKREVLFSGSKELEMTKDPAYYRNTIFKPDVLKLAGAPFAVNSGLCYYPPMFPTG